MVAANSSSPVRLIKRASMVDSLMPHPLDEGGVGTEGLVAVARAAPEPGLALRRFGAGQAALHGQRIGAAAALFRPLRRLVALAPQRLDDEQRPASVPQPELQHEAADDEGAERGTADEGKSLQELHASTLRRSTAPG